MYRLKEKLDQLLDKEEGLWGPCEVQSQNNKNTELNIRYCILYYVCGYVTKKILSKRKCSVCISYFKVNNANDPYAELVNLKTIGKFIYPNPV